MNMRVALIGLAVFGLSSEGAAQTNSDTQSDSALAYRVVAQNVAFFPDPVIMTGYFLEDRAFGGVLFAQDSSEPTCLYDVGGRLPRLGDDAAPQPSFLSVRGLISTDGPVEGGLCRRALLIEEVIERRALDESEGLQR